MAEQISLKLLEPAAFTPSRSRNGCRRDPKAGPGSCWYWWEGCPNAEKRGCYFLWLKDSQTGDGEVGV